MRSLRILFSFAVALGLMACSSGGGSGGTPPPSLQAVAEILFPSSAAVVDGDTVTIVGTASANEPITGVRVNGFGAASSNDFASWWTSVPVEPGQNTLVVEVQGPDGKVAQNVASVTVRRGNGLFSFPEDAVLDPQSGSLYVMDARLGRIIMVDAGGQRTVVAERQFKDGAWQSIALDAARGFLYAAAAGQLQKIDLATEEATEASGSKVGSGTAIQTPLGLVVSADGKTAYLSNSTTGILKIDLESGDRSVLAARTAGPAMGMPRGLCIDEAGKRLLVVDSAVDKVFGVDLASGKKTVISDDADLGPDLISPHRIRMGASNAVALVTDFSLKALLVIDLKTGNRTVLSDSNTGSGETLVQPMGLDLDVANDRALVCDAQERRVVAIDLRTLNLGNRATVTEGGIGEGGRMSTSMQRFAVSGDGKKLYMTNASTAVWVVDLETGNRSILSRTGKDPIGEGPEFALIYPLVWLNGTLYVGDYNGQNIFAVDPASGKRTVISQAGKLNGKTRQPIGEGPELGRLFCLGISDQQDELFVVNTDRSMYRVSTTDGKRTLVFDNESTTTNKIKATVNSVAFGPNGELYAACASLSYPLYEVDLVGGKAALIASDKIGNGPTFAPNSLIKGKNGRLLTQSSSPDYAVLSIDPATGDRHEISGANRGSGPPTVFGLFVAGNSERLYTYYYYIDAVLVIDPVSGDRVAVSQ